VRAVRGADFRTARLAEAFRLGVFALAPAVFFLRAGFVRERFAGFLARAAFFGLFLAGIRRAAFRAPFLADGREPFRDLRFAAFFAFFATFSPPLTGRRRKPGSYNSAVVQARR